MSKNPVTKIKVSGTILRCTWLDKQNLQVRIRPESGEDLICIGPAQKRTPGRVFWKGKSLSVEGEIASEEGEAVVLQNCEFGSYEYIDEDDDN